MELKSSKQKVKRNSMKKVILKDKKSTKQSMQAEREGFEPSVQINRTTD